MKKRKDLLKKVAIGPIEIIATKKGMEHKCNEDCRRTNHTYRHQFPAGVDIYENQEGDLIIMGTPTQDHPPMIRETELQYNEPSLSSYCFQEDSKGKLHVMLENPPKTFDRHSDDAVLSTRQVALIKGCTTRTVARHVSYGWLRPYRQIGKDFFFRKKDILDWINNKPVKSGRPRKRK